MPSYIAGSLYEGSLVDDGGWAFYLNVRLVDPLNGVPGTVTLTWTAPAAPALEIGEAATLSYGPPGGPFTVLNVTVIGFADSFVGLWWPILKVDGEERYLFAPTTDGFSLEGFVDVFDEGSIPCFLPGTRIATPSGEVPVETLRPGDMVLTADGRAVPVRFLGRQTVFARFAPPERANPIRIMAGALAEKVPARDLFVSPNHGIVVDGVLAFASALVNGSTIAQVPPPAERFAYYAIETEGHEVILAEGCPAETFMDHVPRSRWDNYRDYLALHPEEPQIVEMDLPHAKSHRQVPREIHARIAERAAALLGPARDAA
jgi:hypothetical protein